MLCPNCQKETKVIVHPIFGATTCLQCAVKRSDQPSPGTQIEFTTADIKSQRVQYADDVLQPYRSGQLSKKYIQKYGTKNLDVTEAEVKKTMENVDVWSGDNTFYRE